MSEIIKPSDVGALQYHPAPSHWLSANGREDLTPREQRSLERVAVYRALMGKYRRALLDIVDFPERATDIATRALSGSPPEGR